MKPITTTMAAAGFLALLSTTALSANQVNAIKNLENGNQVNITATVDSVQNEREFTLRDATGTIDVDLDSSGQSVVLKQGDTVTVSGVLDKGVLGTDINASSVTVNTKSSAVTPPPSVPLTGTANPADAPMVNATAYNIGNLPKQGLVKVSGTVADVNNEKEFTLKDQTGSIDVNIGSADNAAVTEGAQVVVIGYVENGLFSKDINASKVQVMASAAPAPATNTLNR
ncbi:MAG: NirD/YgiW/YdeI family stress tolerance protein [Alphaproteobacteria bacterium]|nr:NirD/YgiW/YdeI family stress tolerance protein [Alphaproteobacteria bacterium]